MATNLRNISCTQADEDEELIEELLLRGGGLRCRRSRVLGANKSFT